jgi:hypothetical protein
MCIVEIQATHSDWIFHGKVGQHINAAVRGDSRLNGRGLSERQISQHILSARGVPKQTERSSI